jgi:DNA-binding NtrC family response regulator
MADTKISLVDDDEILRSSLGKILKQYGFAVTTATSTSEALKHINSTTFDVLLSDPHMPGA